MRGLASVRTPWLALALIWGVALGVVAAPDGKDEEPICPRGVLAPGCPAPDFPAGLEWLNSRGPISLEQLRGKVVLLDFWTYGCINCMHIISDLKQLEAKYPNQLAVIGVHSAKFAGEKATANIRQAILRYGVEHPVLNDREFETWEAYDVDGWPTAVLIAPNGTLVGARSGEGVFAAFDRPIGALIEQFRAAGTLDEKPLRLALEKDALPKSLLSFPGKILADEKGGRLFIADTGHHRVIVASLDGTVRDVIGSGEAGSRDGGFAEAQLDGPQGMALDGTTLYLADTRNHQIRRVDLERRSVEVLVGSGTQASKRNVDGAGRDVELSSPWDVLVQGGKLYVAMAGTHQIWSVDPATREARPFAGNGREELLDGIRVEAQLAQPSGLASDGRVLFFADSEASAIRSASLEGKDGEVKTLIGKGLFEFGDVDGAGDDVRLQHPLGVAYRDGTLYVADTYNHKIKRIDVERPGSGRYESRTFAGSGEDGTRDGKGKQAQFDEPGGISATSKALYVADTNNHAIRRIDLASGEVSTLELKGLDTLARHAQRSFRGREVSVPRQTVAPGAGSLALSFTLPEGYEFNAQAPFYLAYRSADGQAIRVEEAARNFEPSFPLEIPLEALKGQGSVTVDATIYFCATRARKVCLVDSLRASVPLEVKQGAPKRVPVKIAASVRGG